MFSVRSAAAVIGGKICPVTVQVWTNAVPGKFKVEGLDAGSAQCLKDEVRASFLRLGFPWGDRSIIVQVLRDVDGAGAIVGHGPLSLAVAVALMVEVGLASPELAKGRLFFGGLTLKGEVRGPVGTAAAKLARSLGLKLGTAPAGGAVVRLAGGTDRVAYFRTLLDLRPGQDPVVVPEPAPWSPYPASETLVTPTLAKVLGLACARKLSVAVSAAEWPAIRGYLREVAPLTEAEALEVHVLHSVCPAMNGVDHEDELVREIPVRAPRGGIADRALYGDDERNGEVSLSTHGVMYLGPEISKAQQMLAVCRGAWVFCDLSKKEAADLVYEGSFEEPSVPLSQVRRSVEEMRAGQKS